MNIRRQFIRTSLLAGAALASQVFAQAPTVAAPATAPAVAPVSAPAPVAAPAVATPAPAPAPVVVDSIVAAPAPMAAPAPEAAPAPAPVVVVPPPSAPIAEKPAPAPKVAEMTAPVAAPKPEAKKAEPKKAEFAIVDVPANFEIQAKKIMYNKTDDKDGNNLDQWWGRANLMILTQSEGFKGKIHLRMYPGDLRDNKVVTSVDTSTGVAKTKYIDAFELYEAWAQEKGKYVNFKLGRWDNTTRPGSSYFGGYVDGYYNGFLSSKGPENLVQFGITANENMSLDLSLISKDANLNKGDLRAYFKFAKLNGIEKLDVGIGYRTNVFDEVKDGDVDVTHNIDLAFSLPVGPARLFAETGFIGLDNQQGKNGVADKGKTYDAQWPVLGGIDFALGRALDRVVIEAEWSNVPKAKDSQGSADIRTSKEVLGSIMIQKKLNDRFTLTGGVHSHDKTEDFAVSGRLQGRIN